MPPYLRSLPAESTMADLAKAYPHVLHNALPLAQAVLRAESPLTPQQREFLFAYSSGLNRCHYCYTAHSATTEALGTAGGAVQAAIEELASAPVTEPLRALLGYVRKLTLEPHRVTRADADAVFAAGWDERALHDAVAVCGLANFFNRYMFGTGVDSPDEALAKRGHMLAEFGYVMQRVASQP